MNIEDIEIHNYKGFADCEVTFHPKLNVFIGNNSSGKTTFLTAVMKALYGITRNFVNNNSYSENLELNDTDINYNADNSYIKINVKNFPGYDKDLVSIVTKGSTVELIDKINESVSQTNQFIGWFNKEISHGLSTIPIIKFYPANRGSTEYIEYFDSPVYRDSHLETWANIYQNNVSYNRFFHWFFEHETNELRFQRDLNDFNAQSPELKGVRIALRKAFEIIGYGEVTIKTKQIKRNNNNKLSPTLVIENLNTGKSDIIEYKSYGEKALIVLIADIAYNLSIAKDFLNDDYFLNSPGVVIIDEMENHLHPSWQREIVPILTTIFTGIQFFIATHSPQIIGSVNSESLFICQNFNIRKVHLKTKGEDSNTLLRHIFNSTERPKEYIDLINQFNDLIDSRSEYENVREIIIKISDIEKEDKSTDINSLVEELKLQLEAYKFDREHDFNIEK